MPSNLCQKIINYENISLEDFFVDNVPAALEETYHGLSLLQFASRHGHFQAVILISFVMSVIKPQEFTVDQITSLQNTPEPNLLWQEQSQLPALYLAVEYGHLHIAQFLLLLNADKELSISIANKHNQIHTYENIVKLTIEDWFAVSLIRGIWSLEKKIMDAEDISLLHLLKTKYSEAGFAFTGKLISTFAAATKDAALVNTLLEYSICNGSSFPGRVLKQMDLRCDAGIYTAAFWAAQVPNESLLNILCSSNDAFLLTLQQLYGESNNSKFKLCYSRASSAVKQQFAAHQRAESKSESKIEPSSLNDMQLLAYRSACRNSEAGIELFCTTIADAFAVLQYAYNQKNIIALECIKKHVDKDYTVDEKKSLDELISGNRGLKTFLTVSVDLMMPDIGGKGALYKIFNQGVGQMTLPVESLVLAAKEEIQDEKDANVYTQTLIRSIQDNFSVQPLEHKIVSIDLKFKKIRINASGVLSHHDAGLYTVLLNRFNVSATIATPLVQLAKQIRHGRSQRKVLPLKDIPGDIWKEYIIPGLNGFSLANFPSVCRQFHEYTLNADRQHKFEKKWQDNDKLWKDMVLTKNQMITTIYQSQAISRFKILLDAEKANTSIFFKLGLRFYLYLLSTLLSLVLFIFVVHSLMEDGQRKQQKRAQGIDEGLTDEDINDIVVLLVSEVATALLGIFTWQEASNRNERINSMPLENFSTRAADALDQLKTYEVPVSVRLFTRRTAVQTVATEVNNLNTSLHAHMGALRGQAQTLIKQDEDKAVRIMIDEKEFKYAQPVETSLLQRLTEYSASRLNNFSPAMVMGGLYNMFRTPIRVDLEDSLTPLLGEEKEYDSEDEEKDNGYHP